MTAMKRFAALAAALGAVFFVGCSGDGGSSSSGSSSTTHQISGTVSGAVTAGVTVALSGARTGSAVTDASGQFAFSGLSDGSYTVTPTLAGYTFTPASRAVTVSGSDVSGVTFTAAPAGATYTISGTISGAVADGVTVNLTGAATATTVTNGSGAYSFAGLANGSYTITPSLTGYTFSPPSISETISGADLTGVDFTSAGASAVVTVNSNITTATTWTPANLYVVTRSVYVSATLTIQPGTVVKFDGGELWTNTGGKIVAVGTAGQPIVFTSFKDDAHGGDTNADGTTSAAAGGDWSGIVLNASGSDFEYCQFLYAGAGDTPALVAYSSSVSATVKSSIFAHHRTTTDAINAPPALDFSDAAAGSVVTGNTFFDDLVPMAISARFSIDDSNRFDNSAAAPNQPQPNKYNGVIVGGCGHVVANISWGLTRVPFVIGNPVDACNYLVIDGAGHLTLADTAVVKFFHSGRISVSGIFTANGTTGITFTSVADDTAGGDTNGDAASSTPAPSDWQGFDVNANGSVFNHTRFVYAGDGDAPALYLHGCSATVTNSVFAHHRPATDAITTSPALDASNADPGTTITGNVFYDNRIPLGIDSSFSLDDSNSFDNAAVAPNLPQPNEYNGVFIAGCARVTGSTTWAVSKVPLVLGNPIDACNYMTIAGGGHLTLGANTIMKFFLDGRIMVDAGGVLTVGNNVTFTSINDDMGGDTNNCGGTLTPTNADWAGIKVDYVCQTFGTMKFYTCN